MTVKNAEIQAQGIRSPKNNDIREPYPRSSRRVRSNRQIIKRQPFQGRGDDRERRGLRGFSGRQNLGGIVGKLIHEVKELLQHHKAQVINLQDQLAELEQLAQSIESTQITEE